MSSSVDRYDQLQAACAAAGTWPTNLLRSKSFRHKLMAYQEQIDREQKGLFDPNPKNALVEFLEALYGEHGFHSERCKSLLDLTQHLQVNRKDPKCRFVFFESKHSRAPLSCSKEMFAFVMTFLQVMAPFMDLVSGFGKSQARKEFYYTSFQQEDYLTVSRTQEFGIPRLGRSGLEIQLCYNLWSAEPSVGPSPSGFSVRQTAFFHCFDLKFGQSLWVNISANSEMKKRVKDAAESCDELSTESLVDIQGRFSATLITHLIAFEWCIENWRRYITNLETSLRTILNKVERVDVQKIERSLALNTKDLLKPLKTPTDPVPQPEPQPPSPTSPVNPGSPMSLARAFSFRSVASSKFTHPGNTRVATGLTTNTIQSSLRNPSRAVTAPPIFAPQQEEPSAEKKGRKINSDQDPFERLKDISPKKLQELNGLGTELQTGNMVMKLNSDVLVNVREYYQRLFEAEEISDSIKSCKTALADFSRRTQAIVRSLEMERSRIATLMLLLQDGRELFEHILQFRNLEQSKLFNVHAHQSQQRMEAFTEEMHKSTLNMEKVTNSMHTIAETTEKDTASMHIITWVTLVFLPGTFVATFIGSGLFQFDEDNPETSTPIWKPDLFKIFAWICFPLMGLIGFIWYLAYKWRRIRAWSKRQWPRERPVDEEQGMGSHGGSAKPLDEEEEKSKLK